MARWGFRCLSFGSVLLYCSNLQILCINIILNALSLHLYVKNYCALGKLAGVAVCRYIGVWAVRETGFRVVVRRMRRQQSP